MTNIVSLEATMIENLEREIALAEMVIETARRRLALVALIYGGQLSLEALRDDLPAGEN